jgi:hypothetical protein
VAEGAAMADLHVVTVEEAVMAALHAEAERPRPRRRAPGMLGEGQSTQLSLRRGTPRPLAVLGLMSDLTTLPADRLIGALPLHVPREVAVEAEVVFLR